MSKNNKIGLIVGTVVIAAIGGGYLIARNLVGGKELTPLEAARMMPENTLFASYITTDSEIWSKLGQFGTPEAQKLIGEPLKQMQEQVKEIEESSKEHINEGITYKEDIQPWLGNMMLAVLPPETETPQVLLVIGIKDKLAAARFFEKITKEAEENLVKSEYKGITIIESKEIQPNQTSVVAILENANRILISSDKETVQKAIDTYKNGTSFANKKGAKEVLTSIENQNNTLFQLYLPDYNGLMRQYLKFAELYSGANMDAATMQTLREQLDRYNYVDSMVISVGIEDDRGISIKSAAKYNSNAQKLLESYPDISGKILSKMPGDSIALMSSGGIAQAWSWLAEEFAREPELKEVLDEARDSVQSAVNLDLDKDIIGWMDREFAISLLPSDNTPVMLSGAMVITTTDRATAEKTIDTLETLAKTSGNVPISNTEVAGKEVTEYRDYPGGTVMLAYTWLDDKSFAISIGDKADKIIDLKSSDSIAENQDFKEITRDFPKKNYGYFYVNFKEVNSLIDRFSKVSGQPVPSEAKAFLDSIKGIAAVSTITNSTLIESDMLIELNTKAGN